MSIAFPGLSINGFTNSSNGGIVFVGAEGRSRSARIRPERKCHRVVA